MVDAKTNECASFSQPVKNSFHLQLPFVRCEQRTLFVMDLGWIYRYTSGDLTRFYQLTTEQVKLFLSQITTDTHGLAKSYTLINRVP